MKKSLILVATLAIASACSETKKEGQSAILEVENVSKISEIEQKEGFKTLFDGTDTKSWHTYHKDSVTWAIEEGVLHTKGGNHDLVSNDEFENFDLRFDWNVGKGGNSGVIYMVQDKPEIEDTYMSGIEYQIIDDKNWPDKLENGQLPGAAYDLYPPIKLANNPQGTWNSGRIVADKGHISHYVNDVLTAEYDWNSPDYLEKFNKSKFKDWPFAKVYKGHLALQDHGQEVSYRNIRIKTL